MAEDLTAVVLAAGGGTRMRSRTNKMLHEIGGRSLVGHALAAVRGVEPARIAVVVGQQREQVEPHVTAHLPEATIAVQDHVGGTGHAVMTALAVLGDVPGTVLVTYGDVPLQEATTLRALLERHAEQGAAVTVLTATVDDPTGYGRIVRGPDGSVRAIVEEKDADVEQRRIGEINSGIFAFDADFLQSALDKIDTDNAQGEMYLTDTVAIAVADGLRVVAESTDDRWQTEGVNDRAQLARVGAELNRRVLDRWLRAGVTVVDPASTWVDVTVELAPDVTLRPGVQLHGSTRIEEGAAIGPDCTLTDVAIGPGASVVRTHGTGAVIGADANVGPWAYLRPGTNVGERGKIGTFVETKNAEIGAGAKVPHLSYIGDAEIGEGTNIGAATITANYDGVAKHRTKVGRHVHTGSDNVFVAPVEIGDGASTGAGTIVRRDVPAGALAVSTGPQRNLEGWVRRKRPGSASAQAADDAQRAMGHTGGTAPPRE